MRRLAARAGTSSALVSAAFRAMTGASSAAATAVATSSASAMPSSTSSSVPVPAALSVPDAFTPHPSYGRAAFQAAFGPLVDDLEKDLASSYALPADALAYIRRNVEYNTPHGKLTRGLAVGACVAAFDRGDAPLPQRVAQAHALGWCVELLQAFFLVADDIMDGSETRRGQACFYKLPEIGLNAVNDSLMLEMMIYRVLRMKFRAHPAYVDLVELFQDVTYTTEVGQMLDLTSQQTCTDAVDLSRFTEEALERIYKYKTSHYSFYLPVALGMRLAGVEKQSQYETARSICLALGNYFQAQDDFLDAFGDPQVTGKVGTDIEENTCTWLVVEALKRVDEGQRKILKDNYGRKEPANVKAVKQLYIDLGLKKAFAELEEREYKKISAMIDEVKDMPVEMFRFFLAKIHKRKK